MADKEVNAFEIHLFALKRKCERNFVGGKILSFDDFRAMGNHFYDDMYGDLNDEFLYKLFEWFIENSIFKRIGNKYGPEVIIFDSARDSQVGVGGNIARQFSQMANADSQEFAEDWLKIVMRNSLASKPLAEALSETSDDWAPLPIDREDEKYTEAVEATEEAIKTIKQDNGYAANESDERNGIVAVSKGTLDALREGTTSRDQVESGLIKPFTYLAKKFGDTAIGIVAKKAVEAILGWLAAIS